MTSTRHKNESGLQGKESDQSNLTTLTHAVQENRNVPFKLFLLFALY